MSSPLRAAVAACVLVLALAACDVGPDLPPPPQRLGPSPAAASPVLEPARSTASPVLLPRGRLDRLLTSGPLGDAPGALVVDALSGAVLLERDPATPRTPASVLKLVTAAATVMSLDPQQRLRTRVVTGAGRGEVVLVGAGDTTLTADPDPRLRPRRARLADLAAATADALRAAGAAGGRVRVSVDDTLFAGPAVPPDWPASYTSSGVVAPVSALTLDGGRVDPAGDVRAADPALHTGRRFGQLLRAEGLSVGRRVDRTQAAPSASELAAVESPTVAELVELMLASSDNDLAEALLRLAAVARDRPATFAGGTAVAADVLAELGVTTTGVQLLDGSGLARGSRLPPRTLAELFVVAAGERTPAALDVLHSGLPVAGFSGTLSQRFLAGITRDGAGIVRAKTGTLTGVSTLAGVTTVRDRPVAFVVMSDGVTDTLAARSVLDRFAATVASAGG